MGSIAERVDEKLSGDPQEIFMTPEEAAFFIDSNPDSELAIAFYESVGRRMTGKEIIQLFEDLGYKADGSDEIYYSRTEN